MEKKLLLGVCGGIACYKICELVRILKKNNFLVRVIMTEAATKFVTPLVFQTLSDNPVYLDMFLLEKGITMKHISLSRWADICVIAPLSANTLSKIALGLCDNLLTTVVCALPSSTKVILVPAMNENMWRNPVIQENTKRLEQIQNYIILKPEEGDLVIGKGEGRLPPPMKIFEKVMQVLKR